MESRTSKMDAASSSRRRMAWSASAREWHGAFCSSHAPNSHPSSHRWKRGPKPSHRHYSSPIAIDSNERILHQSPQHDCALPQADKPAIIRPIPLGFIITLWRRNRYRRSLFGKRVEEVRIANNFHSMIGPSSARFRKTASSPRSLPLSSHKPTGSGIPHPPHPRIRWQLAASSHPPVNPVRAYPQPSRQLYHPIQCLSRPFVSLSHFFCLLLCLSKVFTLAIVKDKSNRRGRNRIQPRCSITFLANSSGNFRSSSHADACHDGETVSRTVDMRLSRCRRRITDRASSGVRSRITTLDRSVAGTALIARSVPSSSI